MKVYLDPPQVASPSLRRVADALTRYKPDDVEIVHDRQEAELVVLHVIGRQDQSLEEASQVMDYAVIQYAVRSTLRPHTGSWLPLWRNARLVWSYYDLPYLCQEDEVSFWFPFYYAPLGVDEVFHKRGLFKNFMIATSGQSYLTESVRECIKAARGFELSIFHLGSELKFDDVVCRSGISDEELAVFYEQCLYVSGLRRIEGFELPAAEGLLCGARPIMFDRPHYRQWFNDFAIFIPETPRDQTINDLIQVFSKAERLPVTDEEIAAAREIFNWETICKGFWERVT